MIVELASDQGETPTARAITERLAKIRKIVKESTNNETASGKAPSTPQSSPKRAYAGNTTPTSKRAKVAKVKKEEDAGSDGTDDDAFGAIIKSEVTDPVTPTPRSSTRAKRIDYSQFAALENVEDGEGGVTGKAADSDGGSNFEMDGENND